MTIKAKKVISIILSLLGAGGTVGTAILASRNTKKHIARQQELSKEQLEALTKKERVKMVLKDYAPTIVCGGCTVASIITGTVMSQKIEASLTASLIAVDQAAKRYKGKIKQYFPEADKKVKEIISMEDTKNQPVVLPNGKVLYHNEFCGAFYATPADIRAAVDKMNYELHVNKGWFTLKEFLEAAKAEIVTKTTHIQILVESYGYNADFLTEMWNDIWFVVDEERQVVIDGQTYFELDFLMPDPILDPLIWDDTRKNLMIYDLEQRDLDEARDLAEEYQTGQAEHESPEDDAEINIDDYVVTIEGGPKLHE